MRRLLLTLALAAVAGCSAEEDETSAKAPGWDEVTLTPAEDLDPAPDVVEIAIEAKVASKRYPGTKQASEIWGYDGRVPGPLIQAKQGDTLKVKLANALPEETTVHWHGVRLPNSMDGVGHVQKPVAAGSSFDYSFPLKDAGLYWFHPHVRSDVQVEKGLYGAIVVRGDNEPEADREAIFVLDDVRVNDDGTFPEYLDDEQKMLGRHGNVLLVNGEQGPKLEVRRGSLQRWRLVNAANGRFFNLRLPGHTLRVIGTDGGLVPKPWDVEQLLIAPGERHDVMFVASGEAGESLTLWNEPYERGHHTGEEPPMPLATLSFDVEAPLEGRSLPSAFPDIETLPVAGGDFQIALGEAFQGGDLVFTVNGKTWPDVPPFAAPVGSVRTLDVKNDSDMDHPFHLHGSFFQVHEPGSTGQVPSPLAWKDTLIVPAKASLRLVSRFDEPGHWMYHCHILEHAEGGMMGQIDVQ